MKRGKRANGQKVKRENAKRPFYPFTLFPSSPLSAREGGWTLIELVITLTVLTVLTMAVIPIVRNNIRRQKEQRLREVLRDMRSAIDEFKRDTVAMQCGPTAGVPIQQPQQQQQQQQQGQMYIDPRSRVMIADCTIFGVDNPDRLPPTLEMLAEGVDVVPRPGAGAGPGMGSVDTSRGQATDTGSLVPKKKYYLREIPVDPITGERDWCVRSSYDPPGDCSAAPVNVFDVSSKAEGKALNGENYSDW